MDDTKGKFEPEELLIISVIKHSYDKSKGKTFRFDVKNLLSDFRRLVRFKEEYREITGQYIGRRLEKLRKIKYLNLESFETGRHRSYSTVEESWNKNFGEIIEDIHKKWTSD